MTGQRRTDDGSSSRAGLGAPGLRIASATDEICATSAPERVLGLRATSAAIKDVPFNRVSTDD